MSVTKITAGPILLTGATGQVGGELLKLLPELGEVIAPTRSTMDLADSQSIRETIRTIKPRWIVNPGAYTAVDKAESEPDLAHAINAEAIQAIGEEARSIGAGVIHFSTDYVFDGTGTTPYLETDPTAPVNIYGASKLAGEKALAVTGAGHMIFRTSWVYGTQGKNFLLTILKLARERDSQAVVAARYREHTVAARVSIEQAQLVGRAAKLERAGMLQMLALQVDVAPGRVRQHGTECKRRHAHLGSDRAMRFLYMLKQIIHQS